MIYSFFFYKRNLFILVDVPAEFDVTSSLKEDFVDHQIVASKVECIELLRLKPLVSNILHSDQHSFVNSGLYFDY
jgi:hypothetical protein